MPSRQRKSEPPKSKLIEEAIAAAHSKPIRPDAISALPPDVRADIVKIATHLSQHPGNIAQAVAVIQSYGYETVSRNIFCRLIARIRAGQYHE